MKRNEQMILGALAVIGLLAAFWLLVLSPKRNQASELQDQVDQLQSSLSQAQLEVSAGQEARKSFDVDYRRMVVLGKAVPADSEQTSLLVQLQSLADRSGVQFETLGLGDATAAAAAVPAPTTSTSSTDSSSSTSSTDSSTDSSSTSSSSSSSTIDASALAAASEAAVSTLPIGAAVGPAGLPIMPYDLSFTGGFDEIADFMEGLDAMVHVRGDRAAVRGRLLTVDGFTLTATDDGPPSDPQLISDLTVTTFLTPADQGIAAGATPSGPAVVTPTLTSSSTPTSTDTGTSP